MASSDSERSIVGGISLPQWMKNKINDRYDLDQNSFSPPNEDDSFFYIRYAKSEKTTNPIDNDNKGPTFRPISDILQHHTAPCQEFIPAAKTTPRELGMKQIAIDPPLGVIKSTGTDDGFYGMGAACGHSVVAVAQQMITGAKFQSKYMSSNCDSDQESATPQADGVLKQRRGSKSLPSSPQISPKTIRKNPFFSNVIFGSSDSIAEQNQEVKHGWLSSFVRESNSVRTSLSDLKIEEETPQSIAELTIPPNNVRPKQKLTRPRPSQLREMNFWSPTSM